MLHIRVSVVRETSSPGPSDPPSGRAPRWRRTAALGSVLAAVAVALVASAGAAPTTDTTAVAFVPVPAKQLWGANSISPGKAESVTVIGGTTTVPSNATTVRLEVTVKGTAAGTLRFYPAGNEAGGAGHTLAWAAGGTATGTTAENVGLQNKVTVFNDSTKAASVTVKVTGYSTQVTAGDINGSGGSAGQVLTNNGAGGATWASQPENAYRSTGPSTQVSGNFATIATLSLPKGAYVVMFASEFENHAAGVSTAQCQLLSPAGSLMARTRQTAAGQFQSGSVALTGLVNTNGGTVTAQCRSLQNLVGFMFDSSLVAVQVGNPQGTFNVASDSSRRR